MAMNLVDRPFVGTSSIAAQHRTGGVTASVALHALALLTMFALLQSARSTSTDSNTTTPLISDRIVWIPSLIVGGGTTSGGDHTIAPPRRLRDIGTSTNSVTAAPTPSDRSTIEPPPEVAPIPARPMGDAPAPLAGVIDSNVSSTSPGPGDTNAGSGPGNDHGALGKNGDGVGPGAYRFGSGVTLPTLLQQVKPRYTADAMRLRIQGSVWIECVVRPDGTVTDARVIRSLDSRYGLDEEAIAAAKQWRFRPGTLNGKPVPVIVSIELMFSVR
jgi:protein TonB